MSQLHLFNTPDQIDDNLFEIIELNPGTITLVRNFLPDAVSLNLYHSLLNELNWQQPKLNIAGRWVAIPRMQVWMGQHAYAYSGKQFAAEPWHEGILAIKTTLESRFGYAFNSVLCNLYRSGQDSVAWHADDEQELGNAPVIASYTLGGSRKFVLKPKAPSQRRVCLELAHNELIIMDKDVQPYWFHQVPKTQKPVEPRINLTFRHIYPTAG